MTETIGYCTYCTEPKFASVIHAPGNFFVRCSSCGACGPTAKNPDDAVLLWNASSASLEALKASAESNERIWRGVVEKMQGEIDEAKEVADLRLRDCETMAEEVEKYKLILNGERQSFIACGKDLLAERDEHLAKRKELHQFARDCTMQIDVLLSMREALFASIASLNKERDEALAERDVANARVAELYDKCNSFESLWLAAVKQINSENSEVQRLAAEIEFVRKERHHMCTAYDEAIAERDEARSWARKYYRLSNKVTK